MLIVISIRRLFLEGLLFNRIKPNSPFPRTLSLDRQNSAYSVVVSELGYPLLSSWEGIKALCQNLQFLLEDPFQSEISLCTFNVLFCFSPFSLKSGKFCNEISCFFQYVRKWIAWEAAMKSPVAQLTTWWTAKDSLHDKIKWDSWRNSSRKFYGLKDRSIMCNIHITWK